MKILHAIRRLQKSAGTSTFCVEVCNGLAAAGHEVAIATCHPEDRCNFNIADGVSVVDVRDFISSKLEFSPDVVHLHALWSPFLRRVRNMAISSGTPLIWSTHGLTAPWAMRYKWWKKLPVWLLYQKRHLIHANLVHSTTALEAGWNAGLGIKRNVVIPLGTSEYPDESVVEKKILLFVGRVHPVKGLENLVRAWKLSCDSGVAGWELRIAGPDQNGYKGFLELLVQELGLNESVEFAGPLYGHELSRQYDECACLVLPSFTENFGATVVDALAHGKPCIASTFTPWDELPMRNCGWHVSNEPATLASAIVEMASMDSAARREMGSRGRRLAEEKYTWKAVVEKLERAYVQVLQGE